MKKIFTLALLSGFFGFSVFAQHSTYSTITTTSIDSSNPTSIRIIGQNDPVGPVSIRNISFDFIAAGKAQIQAYRGSNWGTSLEFLTSDESNFGGIPSIRMQVSHNGNVGIGKSNPAHKLDVIGQINVSGQSGGYTTGDTPKLSFGSADTEFSEFSLPFGGPLEYKTYHGHIFKTYAGSSVARERMRIDINGNVGIGTSLPTEKLAVNGKIRAQEIKVENANWPDFVFAKSFKLPTLQETEKHIKEKGHLPGIPSAEEVKTNGVDLGEMNAKLLQKIEELTLHLIEKDKQITELQKLAERVRALELKTNNR